MVNHESRIMNREGKVREGLTSHDSRLAIHDSRFMISR
jgi:hypothetical protein